MIIVALLVIISAGVLWYVLQGSTKPVPTVPSTSTATTTTTTSTATTSAEATPRYLGMHTYQCDKEVVLTLTPSSDTNFIKIAPVGTATYPPASTLARKASPTGARFEGEGAVLTARGETVTLGEGDSAITCSPIPSSNAAPLNFGG